MSIDKTKLYIAAFNDKDITTIESLLDDEFVLEDPVVIRVEGKNNAIRTIQGIFDSCEKLTFSEKNIFLDGNNTIIEFDLQLDKQKLKGVDIIEWSNGKMLELRAYLDIPK